MPYILLQKFTLIFGATMNIAIERHNNKPTAKDQNHKWIFFCLCHVYNILPKPSHDTLRIL